MEINKIFKIGPHILINADHTEATKYLADIKFKADLIVADPDYRDIGNNLKMGQYDNLFKILKSKKPLVHYTYNANGRCNCSEATPHILINKLIDKKFHFKSKLYWNKYFGQKLNPTKTSHRKTATPNDIDEIIIMLKSTKQFPKSLDLSKLHNMSSMLFHNANQKEQFKPLTLCRDIVTSLSNINDVVLDTHMGSANLGIETINADRVYIGIESNNGLFIKAVNTLSTLYNTKNAA